jgi:hypothetical protein
MKTKRTMWGTVALLLLATAASAATWSPLMIHGRPKVTNMATDDGTLWVLTLQSGLLSHRDGDWVPYTQANSGLRRDTWAFEVVVDAGGDKWVARDSDFSAPDDPTVDRLDDGGTFSDTGDDIWTPYSWPDQLLNTRVFSIAEDTEGNKWFGMRDENHANLGTVDLLIENDPDTTGDDEWMHFDNAIEPYATQFFDDDVRALAVDREGRLWIGYYSLGLDVWDWGDLETFDDDVWTHVDAANGLPSGFVESFHVAQDGKVWVVTLGGLSVHDTSADSWITIEGLPGTQVRAVDSDGWGNIWVATDDGVAMLYPNGTVAATHGISDGLAHPAISELVVDRGSGTVWALGITEDTQTDTLFSFQSGFAAGGGEIFVFPNPWKAGATRVPINVFGAPDGSKVEVYDITGELVRELPTRVQPYLWDTLDSSSNEVPSGVYIIKVDTGDGNQLFTKAAIVR